MNVKFTYFLDEDFSNISQFYAEQQQQLQQPGNPFEVSQYSASSIVFEHFRLL